MEGIPRGRKVQIQTDNGHQMGTARLHRLKELLLRHFILLFYAPDGVFRTFLPMNSVESERYVYTTMFLVYHLLFDIR